MSGLPWSKAVCSRLNQSLLPRIGSLGPLASHRLPHCGGEENAGWLEGCLQRPRTSPQEGLEDGAGSENRDIWPCRRYSVIVGI